MKAKNFILSLVSLAVFTKLNAQWQLTGNNNASTTSKLGTTNAVPLQLYTNNAARLIIDADGRVGIGLTNPQALIAVKGISSLPSTKWVNAGVPLFTGFGEQSIGNSDYILAMASSLANARPVFIGRRSRGNLSAPTVVANNDQLLSFLSSGFDGANFQNAAGIDFNVEGNVSAGNLPTKISFVTGTNGSNRKERLKVASNGDVFINDLQLVVKNSIGMIGVGKNNPSYTLDLNGDINTDGSIYFKSQKGISVDMHNGNILVGENAAPSLSSGLGNISIGRMSSVNLTTGSFNVSVGQLSLNQNNSVQNVGVGFKALFQNATGNNNVALGANCLYSNLGNFNVAIGTNAGNNNVNGSENTFLGFGVGAGQNVNHSIAIGTYCIVNSDNTARIGDNSVTSIGGFADWTNISDGRFKKEIHENIPGLNFIKKLRPVSYKLDIQKLNSRLYSKEKDKPGNQSPRRFHDSIRLHSPGSRASRQRNWL